jgi:chemotaxis family two-component system sensor kinase Cph1
MTLPTGMSFPYSVKRHGVSITNCDVEPVNTPGCIQSHGMLLVLHPDDLIVTQVSENCARWTGCGAGDVLGQALAQVVGATAAQRIVALVAGGGLDNNPTYALAARLPGMPADAEPLDISVHLADSALIVELEPTGREPLGALSERDYYARVKTTMARLRASPSLATFCQAVADEVRSTTGLDRVMVYRFQADGSGEIVADARGPDMHSWFGLRFPASDIPKPARDIFMRIGVRPLPDARGALCELVPLLDPASGAPLDMTYCALRGASVMYTEYLANMGVAATLAMPILRDGILWGLIICHHYTPTLMPYHQRVAAEFIGQIVSLEIDGAEAREHAYYQRRIDEAHHAVIAYAAHRGDVAALMSAPGVSGRAGLLDGIQAGGVALLTGDQWVTLGQTPALPHLQLLAAWVCGQLACDGSRRQLFATSALGSLYPAATQYADPASGLLAIALPRSPQGDLLLWFRPEQKQVFNWSGNPYEKSAVTGPHGTRLTPRRSFELWQEEVRGHALPWKQVEIDAALKLRQWIADMVTSRADQPDQIHVSELRSNDERDAFTYVARQDPNALPHGVEQRACYSTQERDDGCALSDPTGERLGLVMRLTLRMDNLLDTLLDLARIDRVERCYQEVNLGTVVAEALGLCDAGLTSDLEVSIPRPMPSLPCDRVQVRDVFASLIANALRYNDKPRIEIGYLDPDGALPLVFFVRDNGTGIGNWQREGVLQLFGRLQSGSVSGAGTALSLVRKLVEQHHGRLWLDAGPSVGSTVYFTLEAPVVAAAAHKEGP